MKIETESVSGALVYRIAGTVSFENWEKIARELEHLRELGETHIVINWKDVDNVDTTGLQTLVRLIKISKSSPEFRFSLVTDNAAHIRLIHLCGFDKVVRIFPTEEDAMLDAAN